MRIKTYIETAALTIAYHAFIKRMLDSAETKATNR